MTISLLNPVYPENSQHKELIEALLKQELVNNNSKNLLFIPSCSIYKITYQNQPMQVALTHPLFQFESSKKDAGTYRLAIFEEHQMGAGAYGGVYPVKAIWKCRLLENKYKLKREPSYVVKMNDLSVFPEKKRAWVECSYQFEQQFGAYTSHLNSKYPVGHFSENIIFLLMKELPGITLSRLIKRERTGLYILTITERLQLSIRLLQMIKIQAHELISKDNPSQGHLIHCDIKPSNIMVSEQLEVNLIDYGASALSHTRRASSTVGTYAYTDPELLEKKFLHGATVRLDDQNDLFSIAMILSELWRCEIRAHQHRELSKIIKNNQDIQLTNIFHGIADDMIEAEKHIIAETIHKMTRFARQERIPYQNALTTFNQLLEARIQREKREIATLNQDAISQLDDRQLFAYIKSPYFPDFLEKTNKNVALLSLLGKRLGVGLSVLSESTLRSLHQSGMNLSNNEILHTLLPKEIISPKRLLLLNELGMPINEQLLLRWLEHDGKINPYWIAILKALMTSIPNSDAVIKNYLLTHKLNHPSKEVLFNWLIREKNYSANLCLKLVDEHEEHVKARRSLKEEFNSLNQESERIDLSFWESRFNALEQVNEFLAVDEELTFCSELYNLIKEYSQCILFGESISLTEQQDDELLNQGSLFLQKFKENSPQILLQLKSISDLEILKQYRERLQNQHQLLKRLNEIIKSGNELKFDFPMIYQELIQLFEYHQSTQTQNITKKDIEMLGVCSILTKEAEYWIRLSDTKNISPYFYTHFQKSIKDAAVSLTLSNIEQYYQQVMLDCEIIDLMDSIELSYILDNDEICSPNYKKVIQQYYSLLQRTDFQNIEALKEELLEQEKTLRNGLYLNRLINELKSANVHELIILQVESLFDASLAYAREYLDYIDYSVLHQHVTDFLDYLEHHVHQRDDYEQKLVEFKRILNCLFKNDITYSEFTIRFEDIMGRVKNHSSHAQSRILFFSKGNSHNPNKEPADLQEEPSPRK